MRRVALFLLGWFVLLGPVPAQEVDQERENFKKYFEGLLQERLAELSREGVSVVPIEPIWVDNLPREGSDNARRTLTLRDGDGEYMVMALCDPDCSDIDLHLWRKGEEDSEAPRLSDVEDDDEPLLVSGMFDDPLEDGSYTLEVRMIECGAPYCYFAVGAYRLEE